MRVEHGITNLPIHYIQTRHKMGRTKDTCPVHEQSMFTMLTISLFSVRQLRGKERWTLIWEMDLNTSFVAQVDHNAFFVCGKNLNSQ